MQKQSFLVLTLIVSLFAGAASANCYVPGQKLHFFRERDPVTQEEVLKRTVFGVVGGGLIMGGIGYLMSGGQKSGFNAGAIVGGSVTGFNMWQDAHLERRQQQRRLRDGLFYYMSHPDFADQDTTDEEREYAAELVQSFVEGIKATFTLKGIPFNSIFIFEQIVQAAQELDVEEKGCQFKKGRRVVHSIEKLERRIIRKIRPGVSL